MSIHTLSVQVTVLLRAARRGDVHIIRKLVVCGANPDKGPSVLQAAVEVRSACIVFHGSTLTGFA